MPDLGEGTVEAEIVAWHVKPGDNVDEDQVIADVMTEKATVELPAPVTGRVVSLVGSAGDSVAVGTEIIVFETAQESEAPAPIQAVKPADETSAKVSAVTTSPEDTLRSLTSPSIRRLARDSGIDLTGIHGSGPQGRIRREDLEPHLREENQAWQSADSAEQPSEAARPTTQSGVEEIAITGVRRRIAQRMSEANKEIPHFAYVEEVDITDLEKLRRHLNNRYGAERGKLTYLPFIMLALVQALRKHPQCNALYDKDRHVLLQHSAVHIGLATHTDAGLKVPVIRDAQTKSLWQLANRGAAVAQAARDNTATPNQLTGSTITITSLGKLGAVVATPIVNPPELAIIAINRAMQRPAVVNGEIGIRRMMNISSSFDHRFVDGYVAAALIQHLKALLEQPTALFTDTKTNNGAGTEPDSAQ
jgi:2-oxoisovalerate dehydrogenase E2 component (dihydrolipoyl transacylase)